MRRENYFWFGLLIVVVGTTYAWEYWGPPPSIQPTLETRVQALEARDAETVRQAVWEALHPCEGRLGPFFDRWPDKVPSEDWCARTHAPPLPPPESPDALSMDMFDCVYDYESGLVEIDTVDEPNVHDSWVLGGGCERLAHQIKDNPQLSLCANFVDDNKLAAVDCRTEMQRHLEIWCLRPDAADHEIRACLRNHLITKLDSDAEELRKELIGVR